MEFSSNDDRGSRANALKQSTLALRAMYTQVSQAVAQEQLGRLVLGEETLNAGRYVVRRVVGQGAFGKVLEAYDQQAARLGRDEGR